MEDDNWDIGAVVRSCNFNRPDNVVAPMLDFETHLNNILNSFDALLDPEMTIFNGISETFSLDFQTAHQKKPDAVVRSFDINRVYNVVAPNLEFETYLNNILNSFDTLLAPDMTIFNGLSEIFSLDFQIAHQEKLDDQIMINQSCNQELYLDLIQPSQFIQQSSFPPLPTIVACVPPTTTTPKECIDLQQQLDIGANIYPNLTNAMKTPLIQTTTRKNQSIRITYELLQEELTNDIWTWRKYGQKHIKDSPFPRNYYKCSTSKLCKAKKKIEKSPRDEKIFLVSYSDEHNHDPPMNHKKHSSCNSNYEFKLPKGINIVPKTSTLIALNSSSKRVRHSSDVASPIITTMPPLQIRRKK
ncbi:hypothetical protein EJD97_011551 [Solanum chilense]|uniref:WRKY domain-containing protein n=1 Tax=Solanum chilense TaxID=4083 RepID=A0A6N2BIF4_SOLCI|nr:hypothetical protein EJD97_011551 [Solanum chilense]